MSSTLDEILFLALQSSPSEMTVGGFAGLVDDVLTEVVDGQWYSALALMAVAFTVGAILTQTVRYYQNFAHSDNWFTLTFVGLGTLLCLAQLGLNAWQTRNLVYYASTAFSDIVRKDVYSDVAVILLLGSFNVAAVHFFSFRAFRLAGRKWWFLPPIGVGVLLSTAMGLAVAINCARMPEPATKNLLLLQAWLNRSDRWVIIWTTCCVVTDIYVCTLLTVVLLRDKTTFVRTGKSRLLRRLLMLTWETMLPPAINVVGQIVVSIVELPSLANFSRVLAWTLGPLYFQAILNSLVGRQNLQAVLQTPGRGTARPHSQIRIPLTTVESESVVGVGIQVYEDAIKGAGGWTPKQETDGESWHPKERSETYTIEDAV
ncbi:hypothetical protein P7C73_g4661, partial [Tremellales sp. Uapishka_1]